MQVDATRLCQLEFVFPPAALPVLHLCISSLLTPLSPEAAHTARGRDRRIVFDEDVSSVNLKSALRGETLYLGAKMKQVDFLRCFFKLESKEISGLCVTSVLTQIYFSLQCQYIILDKR